MDNTQNRPQREEPQTRDTRRQGNSGLEQGRELTQRYRQLAIYTPLGEDVLLFHSMTATEQLARLFEYRVKVLAEDGDLDFASLLGENASVRLDLPENSIQQSGPSVRDNRHSDAFTRDEHRPDLLNRDDRQFSSSAGSRRLDDIGGDGKERFFNGFVSEISQGTTYGNYNSYELVLRPWLWFLTRTTDCRIFQNQSVPDIVMDVFRDNGFADYKNRLTGSYGPREYCVQYRETAFDFISRLLEEEGIYYYFLHEDGKHTLVLADDTQSCHDAVSGYGEIPYYPPTQERRERDHIYEWSIRQKLQPVRYALNDFDFKAPRKKLLSNIDIPRSHAKADYEIYDYPGEYKEPGDGETYTRVRIEELQSEHETASGAGNARGLQVGALFNLIKCPRDDQNREYLVTSAYYELRSDVYESESGATSAPVYQCSFTVIDAKRPFRPARSTPKPIVQGPQTAIVVGPGGEEIHTDNFGRVKCQFHWDRYGKADDSSSCWIRVSQPWAGKGWGAVAIPRIGQEVVVDFLEGDPDQPLITGRVYNADQMPPYALPGNKTQSGIKSRSSKGGGEANFNEIRFEDKIGSEEMYIHAEKDQNTVVENDQGIGVGNDRTEIIGRDRSLEVGRDKSEVVMRNKMTEVDGFHEEKIKGSQTIIIGGSLGETVSNNYSESVGLAMQINVGAALSITAGAAMAENIGGVKTESIGGSKAENIGSSKTLRTGKDYNQVIQKNKDVKINGSSSESVDGTFKSTVEKDFIQQAKKIQIIAKDEINIKSGKAEITLKKNGDITIKGKRINIKGSGNVIVKGSQIKEN